MYEARHPGNHTNNFVESQFLVLVKEYNIIALFERLTVDLENHYKEKLLSVADGSFDGHYRKSFMGKQKKSGDHGFVVPSKDNQKRFIKNVIEFLIFKSS